MQNNNLPILKANDLILSFAKIISNNDSLHVLQDSSVKVLANNIYYFLLKKFYDNNGNLKTFIPASIINLTKNNTYHLKLQTKLEDFTLLQQTSNQNISFLDELIYLTHLPEYKTFTKEDLELKINDFTLLNKNVIYHLPLSKILDFLKRHHIYISTIKEFILKKDAGFYVPFFKIIFANNPKQENENYFESIPTNGFITTSIINSDCLTSIEFIPNDLVNHATLTIINNFTEEKKLPSTDFYNLLF